MARSRLLVALCVLAATAVLVSLGLWQLRRLAWKEALVATVEERRHSAPLPLADLIARFRRTGDIDYVPVAVSGSFDHAREQYLYTTWQGAVGWQVYAPLRLPGGGWLIVNRGFVPDGLRDPARRTEGQVAGTVEITGLARAPLADKPNRFVPDNSPAKREFYWKSFPGIAAAMALDDAPVPFFVDQQAPPAPGGYPRVATTLVEFSNNHLQYALTWFGLAAACLGVGGWFLFAGKRHHGAGSGRDAGS
ncbi:MAG: SURF1-like protein [Alphaproteobacteria bacterium]|nr:MAG: SURF1-like protein [Alphaproteobacteria bacterium]